jgi:UDP-N-acetylmuramoylalanine--D-glutamate ligase
VAAALTRRPRVLVDRLDPDSEALALHLAARGATVTIAPLAGDAPDPEILRRLSQANIEALPDGRERVLDFDIVFVHDYTSPLEPFVVSARTHGRQIAQFADILLENAPCPTIGVTGSAGKSTVATLIGEMLIRSGIAVHTPRSHYLPDSRNPNRELLARLPGMAVRAWQVVELTSSHLEYMNASPEIAVVTRVYPDHVEWHGTAEKYLLAKARITAFQEEADWLVVNRDDANSRAIGERTSARVAMYSLQAKVERGAYLHGGALIAVTPTGDTPIIARSELRLADRHVENALAATAAALAAGASRSGIGDALRHFTGLRHRLQLVASRGSVRAFNDGIAFTPGKAQASLESFDDGSVVLICGGQAMLAGWSMGPLHDSEPERAQLYALADVAAAKVRRVYVIGEMADTLRQAFDGAGIEPARIENADDVGRAVTAAMSDSRPGDNIVLSPVYYIDADELSVFDELTKATLGTPT